MDKIIILANRLSEAVLFDWSQEEVIKLAKEVAIECHNVINNKTIINQLPNTPCNNKCSDCSFTNICTLKFMNQNENSNF